MKKIRKKKVKRKWNNVKLNISIGFRTLLAAFPAILIIMPLVVTLTNSLMSEAEINYSYFTTPGNSLHAGKGTDSLYYGIKVIPDVLTINQYYSVLIHKTQYHFLFWNSVGVAVPVVAGQIVVASMAAYAFSKFPFKGSNALFFLYIIAMMMPYQVTLIPNYIIASYLGLLDRTLSIILPGVFSAFGVFLLRQYMITIPNAYCESAVVDGANPLQIFLRVILPMSKAGIASLAMLVFIDSWNMVEQPLIFLTDHTKTMLSVFLSVINSNERGIAFAAASIYMAPMLLVFLYGENYLVDGIRLSGLKE